MSDFFLALRDSVGMDLYRPILLFLEFRDYLSLYQASRSLKEILGKVETWHQSELTGNKALTAIFHDKKNVMLTGLGGTGKSYTFGRIVHHAKQLKIRHQITSTTGISSSLVEGVTVHCFFGIGLYKRVESLLKTFVGQGKSSELKKRLNELDLLLIDEVSMLGAKTLEILDFVARLYREDSRPFGGLQLVFSGDFYQLPAIREKRVFTSPLWKKLNIETYEFQASVRHKNDLTFHRLLSRLRTGSLLLCDRNLLAQRSDLVIPEGTMRLYSTNLEADSYNQERFKAHEGPESSLQAFDQALALLVVDKKRTFVPTLLITPAALRSALQKQLMRLPTLLMLKPGAQYYITANLDPANGILNGKACRFVNLKFIGGFPVAVVTLAPDYKETYDIYPITRRYQYFIKDGSSAGQEVYLRRTQIPLKLGYAMTIHYAQGATLDKAFIDCSRIRTCAQMYVGASRVRCLDDLYIKGFQGKKYKPSDQVQNYYEELKKTGRVNH